MSAVLIAEAMRREAALSALDGALRDGLTDDSVPQPSGASLLTHLVRDIRGMDTAAPHFASRIQSTSARFRQTALMSISSEGIAPAVAHYAASIAGLLGAYASHRGSSDSLVLDLQQLARHSRHTLNDARTDRLVRAGTFRHQVTRHIAGCLPRDGDTTFVDDIAGRMADIAQVQYRETLPLSPYEAEMGRSYAVARSLEAERQAPAIESHNPNGLVRGTMR